MISLQIEGGTEKYLASNIWHPMGDLFPPRDSVSPPRENGQGFFFSAAAPTLIDMSVP
jgi:hypothetical protein